MPKALGDLCPPREKVECARRRRELGDGFSGGRGLAVCDVDLMDCECSGWASAVEVDLSRGSAPERSCCLFSGVAAGVDSIGGVCWVV